MIRVLGLDISTQTGVAVVDFGRSLIHAEEICFKKSTGLERCGLIAGRVGEVIEQFSPTFAVIENYGFGNSNTLATLVEIGTVVRYFLYQEGFPFMLVAPTGMKRFVAGAGNATKDMVMMKVYKRWGIEPATNNIADAIGLAMFGLGCAGDEFPAEGLDQCQKVLAGFPEVASRIASCRCN